MPFNPLTDRADKIWLAQTWSPGLADIAGAGSPRKWEELESYGWSGAISRFRGIQLAHFSVRFRLYTDDDFNDWYVFKPLVDKPPPRKKPRALDIYHPILADQGIFSVDVEDLGQLEQTGDGEWTVEIKFIEHRALKYALATPDGAIATPVDPAEVEIGELSEQLMNELAKH